MTSTLDTPIVSIFDLMVERHIRLHGGLEDAVTSGNIPTRRLRAERGGANGKKSLFKSKPSPMMWPLPEEPEFVSPPAANAITAAHLTKKHTTLKMQPPTEKDAIKKLVEKMSNGPGRTRTVTVTPRHSQSNKKSSANSSKTVVIAPRRKKAAGQGSFRVKSKITTQRPPLSPRRAEDVAKDAKPQSKAKPKKNSLEKMGLQLRNTRSVDPLGNADVPVSKRWRL